MTWRSRLRGIYLPGALALASGCSDPSTERAATPAAPAAIASTSSAMIPLPAGPTALAGQTITVASVGDDGQAHYAIPLYMPPGVREVKPALSIEYASGNLGGQLGAGWSIGGLSAITRCALTWAQDGEARPVQGDARDGLCLDGVRLRLESGSYGAAGSTYRTEIESFSKITLAGSIASGASSFRVETADGYVHRYGATEDARIRFARPGQDVVRVWARDRVRPLLASSGSNPPEVPIEFAYATDPTNHSYRVSRIAYAAYQVAFDYETRPTSEIDAAFVAGTLVREVTRLTRVAVRHVATGALIRSYDLRYEPALSTAGRSRLASITECAGAAGTRCLAPVQLTYQDGQPGLADPVASTVVAGAPPWFADVNGDGRTDLIAFPGLSSPGTLRVSLGRSDGRFDGAFDTGMFVNGDLGTSLADFNADGRDDLLFPTPGTWRVLLGDAARGLSGVVDLAIPVGSLDARLYDVTGDARLDFVWIDRFGIAGGDVIRYRRRQPNGGFSSVSETLFGPLPARTKILSSGVGSDTLRAGHVPDFDGDGRADFLLIVEDENAFQTLTAVTSSGRTTAMPNYGEDQFCRFADINGDGMTDVAYLDASGRLLVQLSDGMAFTPAFLIDTGPFIRGAFLDWNADGNTDLLMEDTAQRIHLLRSNGDNLMPGVPLARPRFAAFPTAVDIDGDGLSDLVELDGIPATVLTSRHLGPLPDLLATASDNHGNLTRFGYATLADSAVHTRGDGAGFPEQDYAGPIAVVRDVQLPDGNGSPLTIAYTYAGARIHRQGRGFLGFGRRTTIDIASASDTIELYLQQFPLIGRIHRTEVIDRETQTPRSRTTTAWASHSYGPTESFRAFPYPRQSTAQIYEVAGPRRGALITTTQITTTTDPTTGTAVLTTGDTTEATTAGGAQPGAVYREIVESPAAKLTTAQFGCGGRPQLTRITRQHDQLGGAAQTRTQESRGEGCFAQEVVIEPGEPELELSARVHAIDSFGNVLREALSGPGVISRESRTTWSADGRFPIALTQAFEVTQLEWDPVTAQLIRLTDPRQRVTRYEYDELNRRTREIRPDGTATVTRYERCAVIGCLNANNQLVVLRDQLDASGAVIRRSALYTDRLGRVMATSEPTLDGAYNLVETQYDALGRISRRSAPCLAASCARFWTTYGYDLADRLISIARPTSEQDPTLTTSRIEYDGLTTTFIDELGKRSARVVSATGRLVRSSDHAGYAQIFDYDGFGDPIRVTDSLGNTLQTLRYNARGMKVEQVDMDAGRTTYVPNAFGELVSRTDAKGQTTTFTYDLRGRLLEQRTAAESITYSRRASVLQSIDIREVSPSTGSLGPVVYQDQYQRDPAGRIITRTVGGSRVSGSAIYRYTYDPAGQLDTLTLAKGTISTAMRYAYRGGVMHQILDAADPARVLWRAEADDAAGRIIDEQFGNGVRVSRQFDPATGRLSAIQAGEAGSLQNLQLTWDPTGNLTTRTDLRRGLTERFSYDDLRRLERVTLNGAPTLEIAYDALGNITSRSDIGAYTYDPVRKHALIAAGPITYRYDASGNVIERSGKPVQFDALDRVTLVDGTRFRYGPNHQPIYQSGARDGIAIGVTTDERYGELIEFSSSTTPGNRRLRFHIPGPGRIVAIHVVNIETLAAETHYLTRDHLGSVDAILGPDGALKAELAFGAFGLRRDADDLFGPPANASLAAADRVTTQGFTGHTMAKGGIVHMRGRVYDAQSGRFLSPDPFIDGVTQTQGWNRYSYVHNRPLSATDPSGFLLDDEDDELPGFPRFPGFPLFPLPAPPPPRFPPDSRPPAPPRPPTTPPAPTPMPPPRPVRPPPPNPVLPNQGPAAAKAVDPSTTPATNLPDFIEDTPNGFRLNRLRYNKFLIEQIVQAGPDPISAAQAQTALYKDLIIKRDQLAVLTPAQVREQFDISADGDEYAKSVQLELVNSLDVLARSLAGPAAVGEALTALEDARTAFDLLRGGGVNLVSFLRDLLLGELGELIYPSPRGLQIECGNLVTPRYECILVP